MIQTFVSIKIFLKNIRTVKSDVNCFGGNTLNVNIIVLSVTLIVAKKSNSSMTNSIFKLMTTTHA